MNIVWTHTRDAVDLMKLKSNDTFAYNILFLFSSECCLQYEIDFNCIISSLGIAL